jgi:hypothetical protein
VVELLREIVRYSNETSSSIEKWINKLETLDE